MPIGKYNLKALRVEANLTQQEVADSVGRDLKTYRKYELEETSIPSDVLIELSKKYGVSTDYILGLVEFRNIGNKEISQAIGLSESSIEALRFFSSPYFYSREHQNNIDFINIVLEAESEKIAEYKGYLLKINKKNKDTFIQSIVKKAKNGCLSIEELNQFFADHPDKFSAIDVIDPVRTLFHTMMQYLKSETSELRYFDGEYLKIIDSETTIFDVDETQYKIADLSREMLLNSIEKWLTKKREELDKREEAKKNGINKAEDN